MDRSNCQLSQQLSNKPLREGFLTRCNVSQIISSKTASEYYVLTSGYLDCYPNERCTKLKKRYALALVTTVETTANEAANEFVIVSTEQTRLVLRAENKEECVDWVEAVSGASAKWHTVVEEDDWASTHDHVSCVSFPSQKIPLEVSCLSNISLYEECAMMKYARTGTSIPHERIFKMDKESMQVLWRKPGRRSLLKPYSWKCALFVGDIVEVRFGQQTRNFEEFPYAEVEKQSFSLIFEKECGEWCGINSLDLIADSVASLLNWRRNLQLVIYGRDEKKGYRETYFVMDPLVTFLKRYWSIHEERNMLNIDGCTNFVWRLYQQNVSKRVLRNFIQDILKSHFSDNNITWECFFFVFNLLCHSSSNVLYTRYKRYVTSECLGMTPAQFLVFLSEEQKVAGVDIHAVKKLIKHHDKHNRVYKQTMACDDPLVYQQSSECLSFHGFVSFLRSADNDIMQESKEDDMTKPLSHYFINSSHNTYLTGHQLTGLSSCEAYVYALLNGSRCLEIDCWDGPDEPIVTHGLTLTTKVKLCDVLEVIKAYAFDVSPYPIILSIENHCCEEQQKIMALQFHTIFGEMLATEDLSENNILPSPEELKYKVILKGHAQPKTRKVSRFQQFTRRISCTEAENTHKMLAAAASLPYHRKVAKSKSAPCEITSPQPEREEEEEQVPLRSDMSSLIVYCKTVPYKANAPSLNCTEMHSFNENNALAYGEASALDMVLTSQHKMIRTYPRGTRVESSNYNPMLMWQYGMHMAAINIQKPDAATHVNTGFFKKSAGCGYVLKPVPLTRKGSSYHPRMKTFHQSETFAVEIVCGQFIDWQVFAGLPIFVEVATVGLEASCDSFSTEVSWNTFNPLWKENQHTFDVIMPKLCVVYFKVFTMGRISKLIYQNCFPVDMVRPGLRYVPLCTVTGVKRHENGLFVDISRTRRENGKVRDAWRKAARSTARKSSKGDLFSFQNLVRQIRANALT